MSDFWDSMQSAFLVDSDIDRHLQGKETRGATTLRDLTEKSREANTLPLPQVSGTRVLFESNLGAVLTYDDVPNDGLAGTVVTVRTGSGDATSMDENVFVLFDDGKFRSIRAEHLRLAEVSNKKASAVRIRVADVMDISSFFAQSSGRADELVHKATKDLWRFKKDGGAYVIERLFDETGAPLKV